MKKILLLLLFLTFNLNAQGEVKLPLDPITNCELRYLYFPNLQVYFDSKTATYLYIVNGEIIESVEKPRIGYSVYNGHFVQIKDYDGDDIFNYLEEHKKLYPYISSKNRGNKCQ
jgi:hypothetical protein